MATTTWKYTADDQPATWLESSGEVAASWSSLGSAPFGFIFWEGYDDVDWEDVDTSTEFVENWEDLG